MAVYFIVNIEIPDQNDRGPYDAYIEKVKPIVESFGGQYLVRSEKVFFFAGEKAPDRVIVIRFPSRAELDDCFHSPAYAAVKGLRESSVVTRAFVVEE